MGYRLPRMKRYTAVCDGLVCNYLPLLAKGEAFSFRKPLLADHPAFTGNDRMQHELLLELRTTKFSWR